MKASVISFEKNIQELENVKVDKVESRKASIIYKVVNMFGTFLVEVDGRYDTFNKAMAACRVAKMGRVKGFSYTV